MISDAMPYKTHVQLAPLCPTFLVWTFCFCVELTETGFPVVVVEFRDLVTIGGVSSPDIHEEDQEEGEGGK